MHRDHPVRLFFRRHPRLKHLALNLEALVFIVPVFVIFLGVFAFRETRNWLFPVADPRRGWNDDPPECGPKA